MLKKEKCPETCPFGTSRENCELGETAKQCKSSMSQQATFTKIYSNGSKWFGEKPDTIKKLLEVLAEEPLDKRFEAHGDFYYSLEDLSGGVRFFGNFFNLSHVFHIDTNDLGLIKKLATAIDTNKQMAGYIEQPRPNLKGVYHFLRHKLIGTFTADDLEGD